MNAFVQQLLLLQLQPSEGTAISCLPASRHPRLSVAHKHIAGGNLSARF